ncbi:MAG: hypothetical protein JJU18_09395 [Oceanicaulis sp.]|nr:hypothetical protein [Oceanicaulis sp.]
MFHSDDYLRLTQSSGPAPRRSGAASGMRACPRNTDVNAMFDRIGLAHLARRA